MCKAIDDMIQEANIAGFSDGRAAGFSDGQSEERMRSIRSLMRSMHITAQEAMDALDIPSDERRECFMQI